MNERLIDEIIGKLDYAAATMPGRPEAQLIYIRQAVESLRDDHPGDDIARAIDEVAETEAVMDEAKAEIERLKAFREAVMEAMHENAGNLQNPFAYIWQAKWEEIKAAEKARET